MPKLIEVKRFLDSYLSIKKIHDESKNGMQARGRPGVASAAFAVDACMDVFARAKNLGADMVIVHHGLLWKGNKQYPEITRERIGFLKKNGISLYAAHLPLDAHRECGNNAVIARLLGVKNLRPFGEYDGVLCGFSGALEQPVPRDDFAKIVGEKIGRISAKHFFGPKNVRKIGIVSGGGAFAVEQMKKAGIDTLLSGEPKHKEYHFALESRVNAIYAGHYSTERFGVIALAERLKKEFPELEVRFIDSPTGL